MKEGQKKDSFWTLPSLESIGEWLSSFAGVEAPDAEAKAPDVPLTGLGISRPPGGLRAAAPQNPLPAPPDPVPQVPQSPAGPGSDVAMTPAAPAPPEAPEVPAGPGSELEKKPMEPVPPVWTGDPSQAPAKFRDRYSNDLRPDERNAPLTYEAEQPKKGTRTPQTFEEYREKRLRDAEWKDKVDRELGVGKYKPKGSGGRSSGSRTTGRQRGLLETLLSGRRISLADVLGGFGRREARGPARVARETLPQYASDTSVSAQRLGRRRARVAQAILPRSREDEARQRYGEVYANATQGFGQPFYSFDRPMPILAPAEPMMTLPERNPRRVKP